MPMILSPQSEAVIQRLLKGESVIGGKLTVGPLDQKTRTLLSILVSHADVLGRIKGEDQARKLREQYSAAIAIAVPMAEADAPAPAPTVLHELASPSWKLTRLRCTSIRGIAPPGEDFEFDFDCHSNLIYGPNGSGKSSLLGAVTWIITGKTIIDSSDAKDDAPLYKPVDGTKSGTKLRDWPVIATLPIDADVTKAKPGCHGELHLERPSDGAILRLRRGYGKPLEASLDGKTWTGAEHLSHFGITALDLQLSLIAPTIFGRLCVEEAEDTRHILSLMLGFDDLEQLGALASTVSANRTRLFNSETALLNDKESALKEFLRVLPFQLPDGSDAKDEVTSLALSSPVTIARIDSAKESLDGAAVKAEAHLADVLGLTLNDGKPPAGLADHLTVAVDSLTKGIWEIFPSVDVTRLSTALPEQANKSPRDRLSELHNEFQTLIADARRAISRRHDWWKEESTPGSKATLLLNAAQHFDPDTGDCPICERSIPDDAVRTRLQALKAIDAGLNRELQAFFGELTAELSELVPRAIADIARRSVPARIRDDWASFRDKTLGDSFATLTATFDPLIDAIATAASVTPSSPLALLPDRPDPLFLSAAATFCEAANNASTVLDLLSWSVDGLDSVSDALDATISSGSNAASLLTQLSKGKGAASLVRPLLSVSRELTNARKNQSAIDSMRQQLNVLTDLEAPLDKLKQLSKYAENAVRVAFDAIKDQTVANLKHLYPGSPTGMRITKLKLGTGRSKTIEPILTTSAFEVSGQYFANAGLQRAIALAFYFALLKSHRGGLGFIIMDDPILSLDEDHRERWCSEILKPTIATLQVILATHQRQFLQKCAQDFHADRIVELNPRDRRRRVSWRPGDRLRRAAQLLADGDWFSAAVTLRKFSEDTLISLDSYAPEAFFDQNDLTASRENYEKFEAPHPLASDAQKRIIKRLRDAKVTQVLNPAAHSMTEADVTRPMVEDCLKVFEEINTTVRNELIRLDRLRTRNLRATLIEVSFVTFPSLSDTVSWKSDIRLPLVGAAAAKSGPWAIEFSEESGMVRLQAGAAVQVVGNSLEPVARHGQWVLLAEEAAAINDGDLVAARDPDGSCYLRRVWSEGRDWILQSINPVLPAPSITINKRSSCIRKVIGVIYSPLGTAAPRSDNLCEWLPCSSLNASRVLAACKTIDVLGNSLDPIARNGQKVLIDQPLEDLLAFEDGDLAVVQFHDSGIGTIVKQVFRDSPKWAFVSPNPVDRLAPLMAPPEEVRAMWPLRGVLFDAISEDMV